MPDWQLIVVLILIAGAAAFLALRVARFLQVRRRASTCGGGCHGCSQPAEATTVSLDVADDLRGPQ